MCKDRKILIIFVGFINIRYGDKYSIYIWKNSSVGR